MKKIVLPLLILLATVNANPYTPIVYINDQPHNAGVAYGVTAQQDLMDNKPNDWAPSLQVNYTTIFSKFDHDVRYLAALSTITYQQKLDAVKRGLFFQAIFPLTSVWNKIDTRFVTPDNDVHDLDFYIQNSGLADVIILFGYNLVDAESSHATINIDTIFPPKQRKCANEQFIPTLGNGDHIAPGVSFNGDIRVLGNEKHNLCMAAEVQYHYLLEAKNQHLLGLSQVTRANINQALLGYAPQLIPIYNATIGNVTVKTGSTVDTAATFIYNYHKFFVNLNCSYHFRNQRTIINPTNNILDDNFAKLRLNGVSITLENINLDNHSATIPASHLLTVEANAGLACKEWIMPIFQIPYAFNLSLGGTVTAWRMNHASSWAAYLKSGISF